MKKRRIVETMLDIVNVRIVSSALLDTVNIKMNMQQIMVFLLCMILSELNSNQGLYYKRKLQFFV